MDTIFQGIGMRTPKGKNSEHYTELCSILQRQEKGGNTQRSNIQTRRKQGSFNLINKGNKIVKIRIKKDISVKPFLSLCIC